MRWGGQEIIGGMSYVTLHKKKQTPVHMLNPVADHAACKVILHHANGKSPPDYAACRAWPHASQPRWHESAL